MDVAYNQHSTAARRKNRSSTSLHHLTLVPLTTKLPIDDDDNDLPLTTPSYIQGKSAPTTPRLLSRSPARSSHPSRRSGTTTPSDARLPKSKSATHLPHHRAARTQPGSPTLKRRPGGHDPFAHDRAADSDWLLRAGALISTETRESKGQAWLVSRASSTSVGGMTRDAHDEDAFERELREQLAGASGGSRRHSAAASEDGGDHMSSPPYSRYGSRAQSRVGSRSASRVGSRSRLITPLEMRSAAAAADGYFPAMERDEEIAGPDFVNLDEPLEAGGEVDTILEDEAYVRRLVKKGNGGVGTWFDSVLGLQLFSVEEDSEESDEEDGTTEGDDESQPRRSASALRLEGLTAAPNEPVPPPNPEQGGWHDAAWLLTVASKVIL